MIEMMAETRWKDAYQREMQNNGLRADEGMYRLKLYTLFCLGFRSPTKV